MRADVSYRRALTKRICHIGPGRFHRAHQAVYLHELLERGEGDGWGLCGIGLRTADRPTLWALHAQDHLYSLWEADGDSARVRTIGSIMDTIDASVTWESALAALADLSTRIISLTITEAGYTPQTRSAIELVTQALAIRRDTGAGGVTLLSCDNLIENGKRLHEAILECAVRFDPELIGWIEAYVSFPCSMVDRITPAANDEKLAALCAREGVEDRAPVLCEPWRQWIIEDDFVAGRPAFENVGAVFSADVKAYEDVKVSLLNGGHSAIAHLGLLLGHERVDLAMADPRVSQWLAAYLREVAEVLHPPRELDLERYQSSLIQRFANPAIEDRLARLAQDTSQKFQQVLVPPLIERLHRGLDVKCLSRALGLWVEFLRSDLADGETYLDVDKARCITLARGNRIRELLVDLLNVPADCADVVERSMGQ
jgi:mannitol 2-dehydrogenase